MAVVCRTAQATDALAAAVIASTPCEAPLCWPNTTSVLIDVEPDVVNTTRPMANVYVLKVRLEV